MATTSSTLVAGKAVAAGQGGHGSSGRYGLKAKVVAGVAALGCAATLAFGGLQAGKGAQEHPQGATSAHVAQASVADRQQFLAWNLAMPAGTFSAATTTIEQIHFLEQNMLPELAPADQFAYREDRRMGTEAAVSADTFTYREDRRGEVTEAFVADPFTYREDRRAGNTLPAAPSAPVFGPQP